ncbi:MAG: HDOD domain-containing protein [Gammaproteobacteria bacterium]|nr:HDOD domain-containing protein [Gammaproteobacteria bacterium]MBU1645993.1 HDOD domain-containing protein [Gammaproteobacteria bacterium]MBU1972055.1 HDOD domain-containing protein [Gammaproteobacteria bacterium]
MNTTPPATAVAAASNAELQIESRMREEIRDIGIPPRPAILSEIDAEMRKDEPDFKHLADIIGSDVGLAASVIKVANSPYYGFGKKVRSVPEAMLVLGLKVIFRTVAGLALMKLFPHVPSLERFWDSAARTARVSGWLAQRLHSGVRPEDAYTLGLFRDCGVAVLMIPFPEYPQILQQANEEPVQAFTAVEDRLLSINHAVVGSDLAADWLLPDEITQAICHHHDTAAIEGSAAEMLPDATRKLIAVCQVAEYLIQSTTMLSQTHEWSKLGDACMTQLDLTADDIAALQADCREAVAG